MQRHPTYIIAEMACSHDGSENHARTIIDCAGKSGANAIQFQIWKKEALVTPDHPDLAILKALELGYDQWRSLAAYVRANYPDMDIIACIYEQESLNFCSEIGVDAFKLHAADITNLELLQAVGRSKMRIDLSVGACSIDEILQASDMLRTHGCPSIWLMYGLQNFPTPPEDIDLVYMQNLQNITGLPVGYQDHSPPENISSYAMAAAAIGLGVSIVEKHITHDRSLKGADHQAALNPDEFQAFTAMVRDLDKALAGGTLRPLTEAETKYRSYSRKSLVTARPIKKGSTLKAADLNILRAPKYGIDPGMYQSVIGKQAARDMDANHVLFEGDIE